MLTKMKKNSEKFENAIFSNIQKTSWHVAQGKPQLKFERNLFNRFRDNCDTDRQILISSPLPTCTCSQAELNKGSMNLGALLDICSWYEKWQFSATQSEMRWFIWTWTICV